MKWPGCLIKTGKVIFPADLLAEVISRKIPKEHQDHSKDTSRPTMMLWDTTRCYNQENPKEILITTAITIRQLEKKISDSKYPDDDCRNTCMCGCICSGSLPAESRCTGREWENEERAQKIHILRIVHLFIVYQFNPSRYRKLVLIFGDYWRRGWACPGQVTSPTLRHTWQTNTHTFTPWEEFQQTIILTCIFQTIGSKSKSFIEKASQPGFVFVLAQVDSFFL